MLCEVSSVEAMARAIQPAKTRICVREARRMAAGGRGESGQRRIPVCV